MAKANKIRVRLKAYDHTNLDVSAQKIIQAAKNTGATVVGPIPLPTEKQVFTILRSVHKHKDSREQFEIRTHKRIIDISNPKKETIEQQTQTGLGSVDEEGTPMESAPHPQQVLFVTLTGSAAPGDILRRRENG